MATHLVFGHRLYFEDGSSIRPIDGLDQILPAPNIELSKMPPKERWFIRETNGTLTALIGPFTININNGHVLVSQST